MTTVKTMKKVVCKTCRLFDFHFYDNDANTENTHNSDSSDDGNYSRSKLIKNKDQFTIQMFGVNEKGETFCIYVPDYEPFFYIKVNDRWNEDTMYELVKEIKKKLGKRYEDCVLYAEFVNQHKLYGFSGGKKHKFVKLTFMNMATMNKVKNMWYVYVDQDDKENNGEYRKRKDFKFKGTSLELY